MTGVSRRTLITSGAAVAGALATSQMLPDTARAAGADASGRRGTIKDVKHVVILMQENRSFDHYYGALGGVRGFADKQALRYPDGTTVFSQPDPRRPADKVLLPFRMDTTRFDAQEARDLDHTWQGTHAAFNNGAWNRWVTVKGEATMGYFTRADVPWQYALADAFTICDNYFCSVQGPTTPNRLFLWTGTNDPAGTAGGPVISNPDDYQPLYRWTTYPERLQKAGVTWQVYANGEVGEGGFLGDFGDNPLWLFQAYHDAQESSDPKVRQLAERGSVIPWKPNAAQGASVDHVLARFIADCADNALPTVSWVVAPQGYSEHPAARPVDGAAYTNRMLQALWENDELWESTVVLIDFDENDGFFDHVTPPFPAPGTAKEYVGGLPVGLGPRVPMTIVSPWSRGGWVNSQVFDHTSVIRFLEVVTGVHEPNISAWRRAVCGDLTSCFDFTAFDPSIPTLPEIAALVAKANAQRKLPKPAAPARGTQPTPKQETTARKRRSLPYQPGGNVSVNRSSGIVTASLTNTGSAAVSFVVYANRVAPFTATPVLVAHQHTGRYEFDTSATNGAYDVSVYGPNGFVRAFAGTVITGKHSGVAVPAVTAAIHGDGLRIDLRNTGSGSVSFTLASNDFVSRSQTWRLDANGHEPVQWAAEDGWYDVTVTAHTDTPLTYRFAGRIEGSTVPRQDIR